MSVAFVLSGGTSLGAIQVGMLEALAEREILPDLVFGSSAGALNAAWVAGDPALTDLDALAGIWSSLHTRDVFPLQLVTGFLGFIGRRDSLVTADRLRTLLAEHIRYERLEDAPIPLCVVATEVVSGKEVALTRGNAIDAIVASSAIPGVFPPVTIAGHLLMDGAVVNNTPISNAIAAGATRIYVLPTSYACTLERPPHTALAMTLQAISLLVQQRLIEDVRELEGAIDLRVIPPLCPVSISPTDFSHAPELIRNARTNAGRWLDDVEANEAQQQHHNLAHDH